jgi:O-antigen/teichoic acid export membrane protein
LHRLGEAVTLKTVTTVVQVLVGLFISILLNRVYGKDTYGLLVLVYSVTGLASATCDFGAKPTLIRHVPQFLGRKESVRAAQLFAAVVVVQSCGAALFFAAIAAAAPFIAESVFGHVSLGGLLVIGCLYAAAFALQDLIVQTYQALQDWRRESALMLLFGGVQVATALVVTLVLDLDLGWFLVGHAASCILATAVGVLWLPREFRAALAPPRLFHIGDGLATIARFGLPLTFQGVYRYGQSWADKLILGPFIAPGTLGMYYIATLFLNSLVLLFKVLPTVFAPYVAALAVGDARVARHQFVLIFRWFSQIAIVAALVLFVAVEAIVPFVYGPGYDGVVPLTRALMVVFILRVCRDPIALFLQQLQAKVRVVFVHGTVLSVVSMAATAVLVPLLGTWGAILAMVVGNAASWTVLLWMAPDLRALIPMRTVRVTVGLLAAVSAGYIALRKSSAKSGPAICGSRSKSSAPTAMRCPARRAASPWARAHDRDGVCGP